MDKKSDDIRPNRLLILEDDELVAQSLMIRLQNIFQNSKVQIVNTVEDAIEAIETGNIDIALLDMYVGDERGMDVIKRFESTTTSTAFVVVTAHYAEDLSTESIMSGAADYLVKGQFSDFELERSVRYAKYRRTKELALLTKSLHDGLTGLGNRTLFDDSLRRALARRSRENDDLALLFIDIDGFKYINDTYGHLVGDELLKSIAGRLESCFRETDIVCRNGGDEFVVILEKAGSQEHASPISGKVLKSLCNSYQINGHTLKIGASIGVAFCPTDTTNAEDLVARADERMYLAKRRGGGIAYTSEEPAPCV